MNKIPVAILGATGAVGQRFIQILSKHPWLKPVSLIASERSAGKRYKDAVNWKLDTDIPEDIGEMIVSKLYTVDPKVDIVFSGLDSSIAGEAEIFYAEKGCYVFSNSKNHRMVKDVPLLIPEINFDHMELINKQKYRGAIITNPNCSTTFFTLIAGVLDKVYPIESISVVTMQAISGAGYPGIPSLDIMNNVVPFIPGEEEKMESEPLKIMGKMDRDHIVDADITISAQANRVAVVDGHLETLSIKFKNNPPSKDDIIDLLKNFESPLFKFNLPTSSQFPIKVFSENNRPQPRLDSFRGDGITVSVGRVREDSIFDYKMVVLGHNTIKGAAAGSIQNCELFIKKHYNSIKS